MISELTDEEILDFLMTSDFDDNFKPDELKYLLLKSRNFYRLLHGKLSRQKDNFEAEIKNLKEELNISNSNHQKDLECIARKEDLINSMKNRPLSWKERFKGKIILENED